MQLKELTCKTFETTSNQNSKYQSRNMLCCGRRKNDKDMPPDVSASPGRAPGISMTTIGPHSTPIRSNINVPVSVPVPPAMVVQSDFRKVSGISSDIFKQIESIENDHDSTTAAALELVERRGEMIVRILEPRQLGGRSAQEHAKRFLSLQDVKHYVQLVEIVKRPGQTLGLYIREGNGIDRNDGVFISRIALESAVYNSGCLRVGDEILAVNFVDVTRMGLDDVVIIMSIPRRLVLVTRQRKGMKSATMPSPSLQMRSENKGPPVVVMKGDLKDEENNDIIDNARSRDSLRRHQKLIADELNKTLPRRFDRPNVMFSDEQPNINNGDMGRRYENISRTKNDNWSYQQPVITEQPKSRLTNNAQPPYHTFDRTFPRTLENLAEKVHPFYATQTRRGQGQGQGQRPNNNPYRSNLNNQPPPPQRSILRSGSDQYLPKTEYETDNEFSYGGPTLNRNTLLRSSLKSSSAMGGGAAGGSTPQPLAYRYPNKFNALSSTTNLHKTSKSNLLDYSSDTEAICGSKSNLYYYRSPLTNINHNQNMTTTPLISDYTAKFSSLPRDNRIRFNLNSKYGLDPSLDYGYTTAADYSSGGSLRHHYRPTPLPSSESLTNFSADEYRTWLNRTPSTSAIYEQIKASRNLLNQQKAARFTYSAENIHSALKDSKYGNLNNRYHFNKNLISSSRLNSNTLPINGGSTAPALKRIRPFLEFDSSSTRSINCPNPSPVPTTPSHSLSRAHSTRQVDINPAEFQKYKIEKNSAPQITPTSYDVISSENGLCGMLWIHLLAGRGLKNSTTTNMAPAAVSQATGGSGNFRDLYCVLECDRAHKARTVVRTGDMVFDWDEKFELDLVHNKELDLLVYSWDPQYRHKLCYKGSIHLVSLLTSAVVHQLALKIEPRGTLYVRLKYVEPKELFKRKSIQTTLNLTAARPSNCPLFGHDIDKVVHFESKMIGGNHTVPLLIRKCVEEIERRGLDIIGLYRLCGSASKKRLLREAFERNCRTVDLSPENVPDINVITGVLKDYLRELSEPLFSKCVYQMMIDALGVCVPNDTDGSAKLMFSLLNYLPNINRDTLIFLIDHFALVVAASDRNKMSAQSLATVMAPPLIMHSSQNDVAMVGINLKQTSNELNYTQPIGLLKYLLQIWPIQQRTPSQVNGSDSHKSVATFGGTQNVSHPVPQPIKRTNVMSTPVSSNSWSLTPSARTVYQAAPHTAALDKVVPSITTTTVTARYQSYPIVSSTLNQSLVANYSSNQSIITSSKIENIRKKSLATIDEISNIIIASSSSSSASSSPQLSTTNLKTSPDNITNKSLKKTPPTSVEDRTNSNSTYSSTNPFITGIYKQPSIDEFDHLRSTSTSIGKLLFSSTETIEEQQQEEDDNLVKMSTRMTTSTGTDEELLLTPISSIDETEDSFDNREQGTQADIEPSD